MSWGGVAVALMWSWATVAALALAWGAVWGARGWEDLGLSGVLVLRAMSSARMLVMVTCWSSASLRSWLAVLRYQSRSVLAWS
ncbi:MAG: hypothetical protein ACYC1D_16600 [Acidimicrobiales bacterium]